MICPARGRERQGTGGCGAAVGRIRQGKEQASNWPEPAQADEVKVFGFFGGDLPVLSKYASRP
ncbi:hypothetical protein [Paenibacillus sp. YN15]|uniref:hypothetical protein n=1 Tax=Paenibacillus sp. YN15 TaxID=1742774 RepID=UPI000DCD13BA|nr:hypothetical protein [Paenibacillus sp. YN15]RAU92726.1 hypothetical protein DQG13_27125 [Paenibacillus sp. YN15]